MPFGLSVELRQLLTLPPSQLDRASVDRSAREESRKVDLPSPTRRTIPTVFAVPIANLTPRRVQQEAVRATLTTPAS